MKSKPKVPTDPNLTQETFGLRTDYLSHTAKLTNKAFVLHFELLSLASKLRKSTIPVSLLNRKRVAALRELVDNGLVSLGDSDAVATIQNLEDFIVWPEEDA